MYFRLDHDDIVADCVKAYSCFKTKRQVPIRPKCIERAAIRVQEGKRDVGQRRLEGNERAGN